MQILDIAGNNALAEKVKIEAVSEFSSGHDVDKNSPAYAIKYAGPDFSYKPGDTVLLQPGDYNSIQVGEEILVPITNDDVLGKVKV